MVREEIPGYSYGTSAAGHSSVTLRELEELKASAGFTEEDEKYLRLAGQVFADQTAAIVRYWRNEIIAHIPNVTRHSRSPEAEPIPNYLAASNLRFEQWILDTCLRPYDRDWLDYQQEIALRHSSVEKNRTDGVRSTNYVPLRDALAFTTLMNETIKPYLRAKGDDEDTVERMHQAWCKSVQMQLALWVRAYLTPARDEW